jgi:2-iminoacetate synthase ThiH
VCQNDCGYCGIRKHMGGVKRYTIPIDEVVEVAKWAFENRMGTLMLQSGERGWFCGSSRMLAAYKHAAV